MNETVIIVVDHEKPAFDPMQLMYVKIINAAK